MKADSFPQMQSQSSRLSIHKLFSAFLPGVFFGYLILAGCVCIFLAATPGQSFFLGLYTDKFIEDFEISRSSVSTIFAAAFVCSAFAVQVIGKVIDRLGPTRAICLATVPYLCGITLTCSASGPAAITAGFILTRILGPDGIDFAAKVLINRWFQRLRGRAMAVASVTVAVEILLSGGFDRLADTMGWRSATAIAGVSAAVLIAGGLLVLFDSPEALGLAPDGDRPPDTLAERTAAAAAAGACFSAADAARTRAFWAVLALSFTASTGWGGLNVHMRSVCAEHGLPPATITAIYSAVGASTPVGSIAMGWAVDRAGAAGGAAAQLRVFSAVAALSAVSMLLAGNMGAAGPGGAGAAAVAFGVATGLFLGCLAVTLGAAAACLFGRGPQLASIQVALSESSPSPAPPHPLLSTSSSRSLLSSARASSRLPLRGRGDGSGWVGGAGGARPGRGRERSGGGGGGGGGDVRGGLRVPPGRD